MNNYGKIKLVFVFCCTNNMLLTYGGSRKQCDDAHFIPFSKKLRVIIMTCCSHTEVVENNVMMLILYHLAKSCESS